MLPFPKNRHFLYKRHLGSYIRQSQASCLDERDKNLWNFVTIVGLVGTLYQLILYEIMPGKHLTL